jgi:hypothetical protein
MKARRNVRIVVDGQQRMRAILEFLDGSFKISGAHNREHARKDFDALPEDVRNEILKYEIGVDLLYDVPYQDLLDIFARINTYTVKLNKQERLNANYLGYFKQVAFSLGYSYVIYLMEAGVLTKNQVSRMAEAEIASDILVALIDEVQTNKSIEVFYRKYEDHPGHIYSAEERFHQTMSYIGEIYPAEDLRETNWSRQHLFYTLFTVMAHALYGLGGLDENLRPTLNKKNVGKFRVRLDEISAKYDLYTSRDDSIDVPDDYADFIEKSRRGTTDTGARVGRAHFVCRKLIEE